jgi:RPA family protein
LLTGAFFIYTEQYYHADSAALSALKSNDVVAVTQTDYGWLFDGPSRATH